MVFSSLVFTFIFLPAVVLLYFTSQERYRNYILLAASLLFYSYGEPKFVFVMLLSIALNYGLAMWIDLAKSSNRMLFSRLLLTGDVIVNLGILFLYKYLDFAGSIVNLLFKTNLQPLHIVLPIGISFFTFQALSYVIDVYRGTVSVQKNPLYVALYISFFPQLIAGPIVRYSTIEQQIAHRICSADKFAEGVRRFLLGFSKKILLANNLSVVASEIFAQDYTTVSPAALWLGSICYSLQIFYDFSGYSDMAIGLGKIFGFTFEENFNYPYISKSVTEFWRRWHISLGQWFRDYVYIPLGGSRVSIPRNILNLFIVWAFTGIWHGANFTFLIWGLGYFLLLTLEKFIVKPEHRGNKLFQFIWQIFVLLFVNFAWVIFNSTSLSSGLSYCAGMLGFYGAPMSPFPASYLREYGAFLVTGILFATPIMKRLSLFMDQRVFLGRCKAILGPIVYGLLFLWSVSFLILGAHNPFIYFNF